MTYRVHWGWVTLVIEHAQACPSTITLYIAVDHSGVSSSSLHDPSGMCRANTGMITWVIPKALECDAGMWLV